MIRQLAAAILGCALLSAAGSDGEGGEERRKEITFWHIQNKDPMKGVVAAAVKRFEAAHPGFLVKVTALENNAFKDKLKVAMAAGSPPDVFHTWGGGMLAADAGAGRVLDLNGRVGAAHLAKLNPAALEFCRSKGKLYALPADVAAVVFWYNREIFKKHGVTPPKTYKEFLAVCGKLKAAGVTPIALGNTKMWPGAFCFIYFSLRLGGMQPFRDAVARAQGPGFEHESFIRAGALVRELASKEYLSRGFNGIDYTQARGQFFDGSAAIILMGPWILGHARTGAPEGFVEKMGCFPFPALAEGKGDPTAVVGGVNAAYAVAARCKHPAEAAALLLDLTSVRTAEAWAKTGRIPALKTEIAAPLLPPETREVAAILGAAKSIQLYYDQALPPDMAVLHKSTTQGLFAGTKTPEEAARLMEQKAGGVRAGSKLVGTPVFLALLVLVAIVLGLKLRRRRGERAAK